MNKLQEEQQQATTLETNFFQTPKLHNIELMTDYFSCLIVKYRKRNVSKREKESKGCKRSDDYLAAPKYINQTIYNKNRNKKRRIRKEERKRENERMNDSHTNSVCKAKKERQVLTCRSI